ncbi:MAG: PD40 domain-containing protein [Flavobacteriales bacterium]|nr:PD40 domain-containing protein [Flavobacteriales bacterium]
MKNWIRVVAVFALLFTVNSNASAMTTPPDSTTSIVDKASSAYLIEEGRTLFLDGRMKDALIKFRQASVKDPNSWKASFWISKCHYAMDNFGYSLKYALEAEEMGADKTDEEVYFILGTCYHRLGNIDTAIINFQKAKDRLSKRRAAELLVDDQIAQCEFALAEMAKDEEYVERVRLKGDINSGYDDYNMVLLGDLPTAYFTSRRSNTTGGGLNPDDQRYFEDTYRCTYDKESGEWRDASNELGKLNSDGFDALNYVSPDGLTGIMTLNTTFTGDKKTTRGSDICEIKKNNKGTWNTPKIIKNKSINTSYFEGSATLTADGNTMYFVTDRKGDKSSTDIYVVERDGNKWGEAKPLPEGINTTGRETTPFITPDGRYLFFSSNGLVGMGGLDVYVVENKGGEWGTPVNLGIGVNTVNNDTHFVYSPEMKKAFVSGYELVGSKASIDIYEVDMKNFEFPSN